MVGQVDQQLPADDFVTVHVADKLDFWSQPHALTGGWQAPDSS